MKKRRKQGADTANTSQGLSGFDGSKTTQNYQAVA